MFPISQTQKFSTVQDVVQIRKIFCLRDCLQTVHGVCESVCRQFTVSASVCRQFTVSASVCRQFTVSASVCRQFTVSVSVCRQFTVSADSSRCLRECLQTVYGVCESVCKQFTVSARVSVDSSRCLRECLQTVHGVYGRFRVQFFRACDDLCTFKMYFLCVRGSGDEHSDDSFRRLSADTMFPISQTLKTINAYMRIGDVIEQQSNKPFCNQFQSICYAF